ncbi:MAG: YgaP family membrane protein [Bdellovibrionota bacterium]
MRNVGNIDRALRIIFGFALLSLVFFGPQTPWGYVGLIAIVSALSGFCPLYRVFGIKT